MTITYPTRRQTVALVGAAVLLPVLFQAVYGGDAEDFLLRFLISAAAAIFTWRCRALAVPDEIGNGSGSPVFWRLGFRVLFWIAVAVVLFAVFRIGDSM